MGQTIGRRCADVVQIGAAPVKISSRRRSAGPLPHSHLTVISGRHRGRCSAPRPAKDDMPKLFLLIAGATLALTGCATAGARHSAAGPPALPPASDFVRTVDNPWFPLRPGTVLTSRGEDEGTPATDVFRVTHRTKRILGIRATVIDDRVYEHGRVSERTTDWYAQDRAGNVWYLGENTATLKNGKVESTEGTWRAGVRGARAGIFMPADPRTGYRGQQEHYKGHAEDRFRILNRSTIVHTPAVSSHRAMLVQETTPLEPGVVDHKVYVRGIGTVREETVKGGDERYQLVSVKRG
jgi:hypothetical protein